MHRGRHRANLLTRCVFTLHASDGLDRNFFQGVAVKRSVIVFLERVIPVKAKPVHFPAPQDLIFTNNGNVVFRLAGHNARATSGALAEINGHGPLVAPVLQGVFFPLRKAVHNVGAMLGKARILLVLVDVRFTEDGGQPFRDSHMPTSVNINRVVVLSGCQGIIPRCLAHFGPASGPWGTEITQRLEPEPRSGTNSTSKLPSTPQWQVQNTIGNARSSQYGRSDNFSRHFDGNEIAIFNIQFPSRAWTQQHRVVPSEGRDRIRKLLHPTVVGKTTIPHGGGRSKPQRPSVLVHFLRTGPS